MTVIENKHEKGLLEFFGDAETVKEFKKLSNPAQMIDFMWKVPNLQVGNNECLKDANYLHLEFSER